MNIQGSDEWHAFRKDKIGGSDAPVIMEVSPWKTPYQLWEEKVFSVDRSTFNPAMKRGLDLEDKARNRFSDMTGLLVSPDVVVHPMRTWMMASLDAIDVERKYIAEIKCPGKEDQNLAKQGKIPEKYIPQIQHQLEVCELDMGYYFSFDGEDGILIEVHRDDEYIKALVSKEECFLDCMHSFVAPKMNERDYVHRQDDVWNITACKWISLSKHIKDLEKQEKELRDGLISMCQSNNSQGGGIKVSRFIRKGAVDYCNIPELADVDVEPYRKKPVECWKITHSEK